MIIHLFVGKGRFGASVIRRTASLDNLYHKGQWSRDYYLHAGQLQVDKSTQVRLKVPVFNGMLDINQNIVEVLSYNCYSFTLFLGYVFFKYP